MQSENNKKAFQWCYTRETMFLRSFTVNFVGKDVDSESASGGDAAATLEGECAICMERPLTIVFLCGHRACNECAYRLKECHICREPIEKRIQIFT